MPLMVKETKPRRKYRVTPLRQAQQDEIRSRIRDAAKSVFSEQHFSAASMEQIAKRAGLRRSTIYLHYRDKSALMIDMIACYAPRAEAAMATLPGPEQTVDELMAWLAGLQDFFIEEEVIFTVIAEAGSDPDMRPHIEFLVQHILNGLGANNPAFRKAASQQASDLDARAQAVLLVNQLTFVGLAPLRAFPDDWVEALRRALVEAIQEFLHRHN